MRPFLALFLLCSVAVAGRGAEPVSPPSPGFGSTNLTIVSQHGAEASQATGIAIFRGEVKVLEPQMYMECELLTVWWDTNSVNAPVDAGLTNLNMRISRILAETNLLIMTRDATILGDRALYTASNDVVAVQGLLVIIETDRSYTFCTNFMVNRSSGQGYIIGSSVMQARLGSPTGGTNAAPPKLGPGIRRESRPAPATKGDQKPKP